MSTSAKTGLLAAFILTLRPKQWSKNLLVFMALFFTVERAWNLTDIETALDLFARTAAAFLLFCALSGVVYLVNDLMDREEDRRHPKKAPSSHSVRESCRSPWQESPPWQSASPLLWPRISSNRSSVSSRWSISRPCCSTRSA